MTIPNSLQQRLDQLTPAHRQVIKENKWTSTIDAVAAEFNLSADQVSQLELEAALVAVGLVRRDEFKLALVAILQVSDAVAASIYERIDREIFSPLKTHLDAIDSHEAEKEAEFEQKYSHLPNDIQQALSSLETERALETIAKKYNLHIDQIGAFYDVVEKVLTGEIKPINFTSEIIRISGIDETTARGITQDANEGIFKPLQESIRQLEKGQGAPAKNIFEQKMSATFALPKDEGLIIKPYPPRHDSIPGIDGPKPEINDPYLEPIE